MMITRWAATFIPQQRLRDATTTWIAPEQGKGEEDWARAPRNYLLHRQAAANLLLHLKAQHETVGTRSDTNGAPWKALWCLLLWDYPRRNEAIPENSNPGKERPALPGGSALWWWKLTPIQPRLVQSIAKNQTYSEYTQTRQTLRVTNWWDQPHQGCHTAPE